MATWEETSRQLPTSALFCFVLAKFQLTSEFARDDVHVRNYVIDDEGPAYYV
jgi:hypothetical protein